MHSFAVWAPRAEIVDLLLPHRPELSQPMSRGRNGWWNIDLPEAGHGTDYAFRLDHGPARPDPRSRWQPEGVHGPSRVFDPSQHDWADEGWRGPQDGEGVLGGLFYELHVGTFTPEGTLDAAIGRLDHLVNLGVDVVELMPLAAFAGRRGWGYDGVHLGAVHSAYGGPAALQRFVDAAHQAGIGVCLDVVENHLGPSGNYLAEFGPYFTDRRSTPWGSAVNLDDDESGEVRRWIVDRALGWFRDFHVDALRLDAVHELHDDSRIPLLAQLSNDTAALSERLGRPLGLIAESDLNDPVMVEPTSAGGLGMTAQWDDDVHHALHAALTGERQGYYVDFGSLAAIAKVFTHVFLHDGTWSSFRHQIWGHPVDPKTHAGHRFLAYLHNHDQVGNRAVGDRLSPATHPGLLAAGALLVLCGPFTPMLFMGEEWGAGTPWQFFTEFDEPELADAVRDGRRAEFAEHGWDAEDIPDPQDPATRDRSVLDWTELERPDHLRLLDWHRSLIALRRMVPDLRADRLRAVEVDYDEERRWLTVVRGRHLLAVNLSDDPATLPIAAADARAVLEWERVTSDDAGWLVLPPRSAAVLAET